MTGNEILEEFKDAGALLEGHFILSSGLRSPVFLQKARVFMYPEKTERLCRALLRGLGTTPEQRFPSMAELLAILKTSGNLPSLPSQKGQWSNSQFHALIPHAQAMYEKLEKKLGDAPNDSAL